MARVNVVLEGFSFETTHAGCNNTWQPSSQEVCQALTEANSEAKLSIYQARQVQTCLPASSNLGS